VAMEACTQSPAIARASMEAGHLTRVVPGQLVRLLGVGARGIKTDDRDAEALARASQRNERLPTVHLRSDVSRDVRQEVAARAILLKARKVIALHVKSWLRGDLIVLTGRASSDAFCKKVRDVALGRPEGLPTAIETMLQAFEQLTIQIDKLNVQVETLANDDVVCTRLMQVPGVGPVVSLAFRCQVDDPTRFTSADHLGSYLALVPGEATTGGKIVRTRTIKSGPKYLKSLLVQAAWSMWRSRPLEPMVVWARRIADKRGRRIAIVALARKLATVMWSMWRHDTVYEPRRAAQLPSPKEAHVVPQVPLLTSGV
jgi:transposase